MTLDKILRILDREEATKIAGYGKSASGHWFAKGRKRKVPDFQALIAWADHLQLNDADLGELVRDAQRTRIEIMEKLSKKDKNRISRRSILRRDLAKEIADERSLEEQEEEDRQQAELERLAKEKERYLAAEFEKKRTVRAEQSRLERLEAYREKLNKLRRENGNHQKLSERE